MESLPCEICINHIFNMMDIMSVVRSIQVSKSWKKMIKKHILPHLHVDLSNNDNIVDDDLMIFHKNTSFNLANCLNIKGQIFNSMWAEKLDLENCYQFYDGSFKYLTGVKELNIRGVYDPKGYRINKLYDVVKLKVKPIFSKRKFKMPIYSLIELEMENFTIDHRTFYNKETLLKKITFIDCDFKASYYNISSLRGTELIFINCTGTLLEFEQSCHNQPK